MVGRFILRTDIRPNEYGEYMVNLQYCTMGVPCKKATGIKVKKEFWNGDNGRNIDFIKGGKAGHPKADVLNKQLLACKRDVDALIEKVQTEQNIVIPVPVMRSILNGTYSEVMEESMGKKDFIQFVLEHNEELYKTGKIGYSAWVNIQCYMGKFKKFLQKTKHIHTNPSNLLYCRDISVDLINDYIIWRKNEGNSNDTINKSLTPIFKAVKKCYSNDWIDRNTLDSILGCYLPSNGKSLGEDKQVDYLTIEQLKSLKNAASVARYDRTRDFVDIFLFSVLCGGMRVSDLISLRWKEVDMENKMVRHYQVKNHTRKSVLLTIPMADGAIEILERWKGRNENFVFGMLDDEFDLNDEELFMQVKQSRTRTINQSLASLGKKINLPFNLHIHCSRHSYATLGINNGAEIHTLSKMMGHSSVLTTEKVYAEVMQETLKKTVEKSLNFQL